MVDSYGIASICPGRFVAANSIFNVISSVLQMFKIMKGRDENGREIKVDPHQTNGLTVYVHGCFRGVLQIMYFKCSRFAPFPANFKLRFEGAEKLVNVAM